MITYTVTVDDGNTKWYNADGQRHRLDGPAVEYADGFKAWWVNGQLHRLDGPARVWASGAKDWYLYGKHLTESEFKRRTTTKELSIADIEKLLGYPVKVVK